MTQVAQKQSCQLGLWQQHAPGRLLLEQEWLAIKAQVQQMGRFWVQIGGPSRDIWPLPQRVCCLRLDQEDYLEPNTHCVRVNWDDLPLRPNQVDVILLPHSLSLFHSPQQVFQELFEALAPGGRLIIIDFNKYSFWGIYHSYCSYLKKYMPALSWKLRHSYGVGEVSRLIKKTGFTDVKTESLFFYPPLSSQAWLQRLHWMEVMGEYCWPMQGAVYILTAIKPTNRLVWVGHCPVAIDACV